MKRFRKPLSETGSELPGGFLRSAERWENLRPALEAGADPAKEIERRVQELERLLAPYDAIHLLVQFAGSEYLMRRADEYVESEDS